MQKNYPKKYEKLMSRGSHSMKFPERVFLEMYKRPVCPVCSRNTNFINFVRGYKKHCSNRCGRINPETHELAQRRIKEKWNGEHYMKNSEVKKKFEKSMLSEHGVKYTLQSDELRQKGYDTLFKETGARHPTQLEGWLEVMQSEKTQQKRVATFRAKLGVDNPQQNDEIFRRGENNRLEIKEFTVKGKTYKARGFEPYVISELIIRKGYSPDEVINTAEEGCKGIWYKFKGKKHRYHPDIVVVRNERRATIEVKGTYTLGIRKSMSETFKKNMVKMKATYEFTQNDVWLVVVCIKKRKIVWIKNPHDLTKAQIIKRIKDGGIKVWL